MVVLTFIIQYNIQYNIQQLQHNIQYNHEQKCRTILSNLIINLFAKRNLLRKFSAQTIMTLSDGTSTHLVLVA